MYNNYSSYTTHLLVSSFLLVCLGGCINFYKRNVLDPQSFQDESFVSEQAWFDFIKSTSGIKPILNLYSDGVVYEADEYNFLGQELIANISVAPVPNFTIPNKKNFRRGLIPEEERAGLLSTLTIAVKSPLKAGNLRLHLSEVSNLTYFDKNDALTLVTSTGITVGSIMVGGAIFLAIACSCPRVYALDENGNRHPQGSLLSGAIFRSLERQDAIWLNDITPVSDEIKLMVANELPEKEYLDHLQLMSIKVPQGYHLAYGPGDGETLAFGQTLLPQKAEGGLGQDILPLVNQEDDAHYTFSERTYSDQLNEAIFSFDPTELEGSKAYLVLKGKQSAWLEEVAEYFFQQFGTDFDGWMDNMDDFPREKYDKNAALRGMSMNAYLETDQGWEKIGTYHNAGIVQEKTMALPVDISQAKAGNIRIKLSSAFNFWEVNQLSMTTDLAPLPAPNIHALRSAKTHLGEDVSGLLQTQDQQYLVQAEEGDFVELSFEAGKEEGLTYLLQGSGYYHHKRTYTHAPNKKALRKMKFYGPMVTHDLSLALDQVKRQYQAVAAQP